MLKQYSQHDSVVLLNMPFRPDPALWARVAAESNRCPRIVHACQRGGRCEGIAARCDA